jgi:hypothetical protein
MRSAALRCTSGLRLYPVACGEDISPSHPGTPAMSCRPVPARGFSGDGRSTELKSHRPGRSAPQPTRLESGDTGSSHSGRAARSRTQSEQYSSMRDGYCEQWSSPHIADFTPIEPRVRDHYLDAADEQGKKGDHCNPVGHADDGGVTGSPRIRRRSHDPNLFAKRIANCIRPMLLRSKSDSNWRWSESLSHRLGYGFSKFGILACVY